MKLVDWHTLAFSPLSWLERAFWSEDKPPASFLNLQQKYHSISQLWNRRPTCILAKLNCLCNSWGAPAHLMHLFAQPSKQQSPKSGQLMSGSPCEKQYIIPTPASYHNQFHICNCNLHLIFFLIRRYRKTKSLPGPSMCRSSVDNDPATVLSRRFRMWYRP